MRTMTDQDIKNVYVDMLAQSPGSEFQSTPECLRKSALGRRLFEAAVKVIKQDCHSGGLGVDREPAQFQGEEVEDVQDYLDHLETAFGGRELLYTPAPGSQAYVAVYGSGRTLGGSGTPTGRPPHERPWPSQSATAGPQPRRTEDTPTILSGSSLDPGQVDAEVYKSCLNNLIQAVSHGE